MRKRAIAKINKLASRAGLPKLGVFKRGAAVQLIQYVHRIPGDVIAWTGFKSAQEARSMLDNLLN